MKPFLRVIAEAYLDNCRDELDRFCFVFPTRRASQFFIDYLRKGALDKKVRILPATTTMGEFCSSMTDLNETTGLDELCILYNAYHSLSADIPDFDRFRFWGRMILDDFNDADRYLADTGMLFSNVRKFKEIASNYLTEEQREIINAYWPDSLPPSPAGDEFWLHLDTDSDGDAENSRAKFRKLWEVLGPLYERFTQRMADQGLITSGRATRIAAERVCTMGADEFAYERYVFIGFGLLSASELKIFRRMRQLGIGDFYWDHRSPLFEIPESRAMMFVRKYVRDFPARYDLDAYEGHLTEPEVTVTAVPSSSGQATLAGQTLSRWLKSGEAHSADNPSDTAVVLAEEALFVPVIGAFPSEVSAINVTLGIPMRQTPVAAMMRSVVSLQLRARKVKGEYRFYFEDVIELFSHPAVRRIDPDGSHAIIEEIRNLRLYTLSQSEIEAVSPKLAPIFVPVKAENDFHEVFTYLRNTVEYMAGLLDNEENHSRRLDLRFMRAYIQAVNYFEATVNLRGISISGTTALQLVERSVSGEVIRFEGRPLKGLQVMGIPETRCLDFDNLILTSMNEKVYPGRTVVKSFIPDHIRRGFGLPTTEFIEAAGAYNFFRLLSRARRVAIFYDSRNSGLASGEMSRYVAQLLYLSDIKSLRHVSASFTTSTFETVPLKIEKTHAVMTALRRFLSDDKEQQLFLSASAINRYINCPLHFYLTVVENINLSEEIVDYMDSSTYGTVVHEVLEGIYNDLRGSRAEVTVTAQALKEIADNRVYLDRLITCSINRNHNHKGKNDLTPLSGETRVLGNMIRAVIRETLIREAERAPFSFIAAEWKKSVKYVVGPDLSVNMKLVVDRIDRVSDNRLVFIDYKTGNDTIKFTSLDDLFDPMKPDRRKAVLQLLLYANLYRIATGFSGAITPMIYRLKSLFTEGLQPVVMGKEPFDDYRSVNDEFTQRLNAVISEIFNPEVPFTQSENTHSCTFCEFRGLCGREDS